MTPFMWGIDGSTGTVVENASTAAAAGAQKHSTPKSVRTAARVGRVVRFTLMITSGCGSLFRRSIQANDLCRSSGTTYLPASAKIKTMTKAAEQNAAIAKA